MEIEKVLERLKNTENIPESDFVISLEKIVLLKDIELLIQELSVFSGLSLKFVYSKEFPFFYLDIEEIKKHLKDYLNFELIEIKNFDEVSDPILLIPSNLLIIKDKSVIIVEKRFERLNFSYDLLNNEKLFILKVQPVDRKKLYSKEIFLKVKDEFLNNYFKEKISFNGFEIFFGRLAIETIIADLSKNSNDFKLTNNHFKAFSEQMSLLYGLYSYTLGAYHFLNRENQELLFPGLNAFSDALMFFREFERLTRLFVEGKENLSDTLKRRASNSLRRLLASFDRFVYIFKSVF